MQATHAVGTPMGLVAETEKCSICWDDIQTGHHIPVVPTDDIICAQCFDDDLKLQFIAALEHEHAYPVKWGYIVLDPADFVKYVPPGVTSKYVWRAREYETASVFGECVAAYRCAIVVQLRRVQGVHVRDLCEQLLGDPAKHVCAEAPDEPQDKDPFESLQCGKDYQRCPKCDAAVELRDGCNHIFCQCGASFCFICGTALSKRENEHFKPGKPCPRWNQPGAKNAHHDHGAHHEVPPPPWADDPATLNAVFTIAQAHHHAHALEATSLDAGRALMDFTQALSHNIRDHFVDIDLVVDVGALQQRRTRYQQNHSRIQQFNPQTLSPGVLAALELYKDRHATLADRLDHRIEDLQDERRLFDEPPQYLRSPHTDPLPPNAPQLIQASQTALHTGLRIIAIPEVRRSPEQATLLKLSRALLVSLHLIIDTIVVGPPDTDEFMAEYREMSADWDGVVEVEEPRVAEGAWREKLGLRVAVAVYRAHRPSLLRMMNAGGAEVVRVR